jgi:hypothetical protein
VTKMYQIKAEKVNTLIRLVTWRLHLHDIDTHPHHCACCVLCCDCGLALSPLFSILFSILIPTFLI